MAEYLETVTNTLVWPAIPTCNSVLIWNKHKNNMSGDEDDWDEIDEINAETSTWLSNEVTNFGFLKAKVWFFVAENESLYDSHRLYVRIDNTGSESVLLWHDLAIIRLYVDPSIISIRFDGEYSSNQRGTEATYTVQKDPDGCYVELYPQEMRDDSEGKRWCRLTINKQTRTKILYPARVDTPIQPTASWSTTESTALAAKNELSEKIKIYGFKDVYSLSFGSGLQTDNRIRIDYANGTSVLMKGVGDVLKLALPHSCGLINSMRFCGNWGSDVLTVTHTDTGSYVTVPDIHTGSDDGSTTKPIWSRVGLSRIAYLGDECIVSQDMKPQFTPSSTIQTNRNNFLKCLKDYGITLSTSSGSIQWRINSNPTQGLYLEWKQMNTVYMSLDNTEEEYAFFKSKDGEKIMCIDGCSIGGKSWDGWCRLWLTEVTTYRKTTSAYTNNDVKQINAQKYCIQEEPNFGEHDIKVGVQVFDHKIPLNGNNLDTMNDLSQMINLGQVFSLQKDSKKYSFQGACYPANFSSDLTNNYQYNYNVKLTKFATENLQDGIFWGIHNSSLEDNAVYLEEISNPMFRSSPYFGGTSINWGDLTLISPTTLQLKTYQGEEPYGLNRPVIATLTNKDLLIELYNQIGTEDYENKTKEGSGSIYPNGNDDYTVKIKSTKKTNGDPLFAWKDPKDNEASLPRGCILWADSDNDLETGIYASGTGSNSIGIKTNPYYKISDIYGSSILYSTPTAVQNVLDSFLSDVSYSWTATFYQDSSNWSKEGHYKSGWTNRWSKARINDGSVSDQTYASPGTFTTWKYPLKLNYSFTIKTIKNHGLSIPPMQTSSIKMYTRTSSYDAEIYADSLDYYVPGFTPGITASVHWWKVPGQYDVHYTSEWPGSDAYLIGKKYDTYPSTAYGCFVIRNFAYCWDTEDKHAFLMADSIRESCTIIHKRNGVQVGEYFWNEVNYWDNVNPTWFSYRIGDTLQIKKDTYDNKQYFSFNNTTKKTTITINDPVSFVGLFYKRNGW